MENTVVSYFFQFDCVKDFLARMSESLGFNVIPLFVVAVFLLAILVVIGGLALVGGAGTLAERKISADMQLRYGPNRVGPYGLLQFLADGVKMFLKEDVIPTDADKFLYLVAPVLCIVGVFGTFAVIPFSDGFAITDLNVGVFYLFGISSLVGVGVFLGGYASNSKWSLLGGLRGASQIVSYEIPVTLSALSIVLLAGGLSFGTIIGAQSNLLEQYSWGHGLPWNWFIFHNPFTIVGFFIFFIGALAEANRAPFDLPEAESELVSGYLTEYSGMRYAFFALAEYIEIFVVCGTAVALFLGGYNVPFKIGGDGIVGQLLQAGVFIGKTFAMYYVVIWVRWTLPRLRVDQLMTLCWKYLTPISLFNLIGCAVWMYLFNGKSFLQLFF